MATNIKGVRVSDLYPRLYFRSTTSDISTGTSAQYLTTSVQATGVARDSILALGTERVGIGTNSPASVFHISTAPNPTLTITDTTAPTTVILEADDIFGAVGTATAHSFNIATNGTSRITANSAGDIGIGTASPFEKLDILDTGVQLRLTHTSNTKYATFAVDTNHDLTIKPTSTGQIKLQPTTDSVDFFQVYDADGGTPVLNVDSTNERVGIGTASPGTTLDVGGVITGTDLVLSDATSPSITISDTTTPCTLGIQSQNTTASMGTVTNHNLNIITNNSTVATFTNTGNLGLGATPVNRLDVEGGMVVGAGYSGTSGSPTNGMLVQGDVGLGTSNPDSQLTVSGVEGGSGIINLWADDGDDNADKWRLESNPAGSFNIASFSAGSWVNILSATPSGISLNVDLDLNSNNLLGSIGRFQLTDADVAHGVSNVASTNVYGDLGTIHGTQGGLYINGISDQESASARSLALRGICNDTHTDTVPLVEIIGAKRSGTTVQALDSAEIVLEVANHTSSLLSVSGAGHMLFTDADVAHGITGVAPTNAYGDIGIIHGTQGGLYINGLSDQESADARSLALRGICNDTHTDTVPTVEIIGAKRSGTTIQALASAETVLEVANHTTSLMTVLGDGTIKGTDFYIQQTSYARISASNVYILNGADGSSSYHTGATSTTSIDAEGVLRGMLYHAPVDTKIVKISGVIGSIGTVEDMSVYTMISDSAITGDLDGAIAFTVLSTLAQAGALTTDKAYYVNDTTGYTVGAGKFIMIGLAIGTGSSQYCNTNLTFQMRSIV